jgi:hypothetical protein
MNHFVIAAVVAAGALLVRAPVASAQDAVTYSYTSFDADKGCKHTRGKVEEDYGSWRCAGYAGIDVLLSAGDQRMQVSFGTGGAKEVAAGETLPGFNDVYKGTVEWRSARDAAGKERPFATILRWNVMQNTDDRKASGRILVVTRLNPGGVCHVGYVDARANPNPNELARQLADTKARTFKCGTDKAEWMGVKPANN